jgi:hypothetical protein
MKKQNSDETGPNLQIESRPPHRPRFCLARTKREKNPRLAFAQV